MPGVNVNAAELLDLQFRAVVIRASDKINWAATTEESSMRTKLLAVLLMILASSYALTSCGSSAGRGAAAGAVGGAVVGGPVGAAVGAVGGAIIGGAVGEKDAARYGTVPEGGYPVGRLSKTPGFVYSPYTDQLYDVREAPKGSLILDRDANKLFRRP